MKLDRKAVKILNSHTVIDDEFVKADSASLFEMVWEITCDLWSFTGGTDAERRLQRNVVNIIRRES